MTRRLHDQADIVFAVPHRISVPFPYTRDDTHDDQLFVCCFRVRLLVSLVSALARESEQFLAPGNHWTLNHLGFVHQHRWRLSFTVGKGVCSASARERVAIATDTQEQR